MKRFNLFTTAMATFALGLVLSLSGCGGDGGGGGDDTATNHVPVANAQNITLPEDTAAPITLAGTDADGDSLSYTVVTDPAHGTLSGTAPNLTYTPNANYHGSDSFTFKVNDGTADSAVATVSITVTAVNDAPVADFTVQPSGSINLYTPVTLDAGTSTDPDGDTLTYRWYYASTPAGSTAAITNATGAAATWVPDVAGDYTLVLEVNDGHALTRKQTTITVHPTALLHWPTPSYGIEPWFTDGTASGTFMVQDINTFTRSSNAANPIRCGNAIFFLADDAIHGQELWIHDYLGTRMVKDIVPGAASTHIASMTVQNGLLFFSATDPDNPSRKGLWISDGTEDGTRMIMPTDQVSNISEIYAAGDGYVYFGAQTYDTNGNDLGRELWRSDGTESGTTLVADTLSGSGSLDPNHFAWVAGTNRLYFSGYDTTNKRNLWYYDPATNIAPQIVSGSVGSMPSNLFAFGNGVLFNGYDTVHGRELWQADVTANGASLVADIYSGSSSAFPHDFLFAGGGKAYFIANDGSDRLYLTDGTNGGTQVVSTSVSSVVEMTMLGSTLYFTARLGNNLRLWRTDGTSANTELVDTTPQVPVASDVFFLHVHGNRLYFFGHYIHGGTTDPSALWRYTPGDAHEEIIHTFDRSSSIYLFGPIASGTDGKLYFSANTLPYGRELWSSDGTSDGTRIVRDIDTRTRDSHTHTLPRPVVSGAYSYYLSQSSAADDRPVLLRTHRADGTTRMLIGSDDAYVEAVAACNGHVYAVDYNITSDTIRLWSIDPVSGAPTKLTDQANYRPKNRGLVCTDDAVYVLATDGTTDAIARYQLSDGTVNPIYTSTQIHWLRAIGTMLFFAANDGTNGDELLRYDGATTQVVDIRPGSAGSSPRQPAVLGEWLYFLANDGTGNNGADLWRIHQDGTGLTRLSDIDNTGSFLNNPMLDNVTATDDAIYFAAEENNNGVYLWRYRPDNSSLEKLDTIPVPSALTPIGETLYAITGNHIARITRSDATVLDEEASTIFGTVGERIVYGKAVGSTRQIWIGDGTAANGSVLISTLP
jgi:ELWxxDGT repeat protein